MKGNIVILLFALIFCFNSQVLGIDLGTQFIKAALISPGKNFVIVENTRSERKTPNAIAFMGGLRVFEDQALGKKTRYPNATFTDLNVLFPLLDNPTLQVSYPHKYELKDNNDNKSIVFQIDGKQVVLEQIYGMILKNIKNLASKQAGTQIKDSVITIPGDWGLNARTAVVNAANIAGLSVLSILRANTAAALNYAMTRNDVDPIHIMIINAGSYSFQSSIIKLFGTHDEKTNKTLQSVEVISYTTVSNISGYTVDENLANILADKFQAKHKIDIRTNQRSWDTLVSKASDVKQILSANKQTKVFVEGIINGLDLQLSVTRKQLEDSNKFDKVSAIIQQTLTKAGLTKDSISSVQLIGGVSRIPKLISVINDYFNPIQVGTHINGDECMALGAVLHAANMSITFKVKKIHLYDGWPFTLNAVIKGSQGNILFDQTIFAAGAPNTEKKEVQFQFGDEESISVQVSKDGEIVRKFQISDLQNWKNTLKNQNLTKNPDLKLTFASHSAQIVNIKGFVGVSVNQTKVKQITDYVKQLIEDANKEQNEQQDKQQKQASTTEQEKENKQQNNEKQQKSESDDKKKYKTVSLKKNITYFEEKLSKFKITINQVGNRYRRFKDINIDDYQRLLHDYERQERLVKQRAEIKNELQSKLYFLKNSFDQEFMKVFGTEQELDQIKKTVEQKLEWLDENEYSANTHDFKKQYNSLIRTANPIFNRSAEYQSRGKLVNDTFEYIQIAYDKTLQLNRTNSWLGEKINDLLVQINETARQIVGKLEQIKAQPLNQDPVVYNHQLFKKAERLREQYYKLSIIPKPKKQKKAKVEEKQQQAEITPEQPQQPQQKQEQKAEDTEL